MYSDFLADVGDSSIAVRSLLAWFGSGTGLYSGYPSYESIPEEMLRLAPLPLLCAVLDSDLTEAERCGASRFLRSWSFRKLRSKVPLRIRAKYLMHRTTIR